MSIFLPSLKQERQLSLKRLQNIQQIKLLRTSLQYDARNFISLKQLMDKDTICKFSLGQIAIITFNIVKSLLKVYQKAEISELSLENILVNNTLTIKFIELHKEENIVSYQENICRVINLIRNILIQYQESLIQQINDDNLIPLSKRIELVTIYQNKILDHLISAQHYKQLKLFIENNIYEQIIIDQFCNDSHADNNELLKIFEQASKIDEEHMIEQENQQINEEQTYVSEVDPQNQQQQELNQHQDEIQNIQPQAAANNQKILTFQPNKEVESSQKQQIKVIENQFQNIQKNENQSYQNNQFQVPQFTQLQQQFQQPNQSFSAQHIAQLNQQQGNNQFFIQPQPQYGGNFPQPEDLNTSGFNKPISPKLLAFYKSNIQEIQNDDFKDSLLNFLSKNYKDITEEQANYLCLAANYYFNYFQSFSNNLWATLNDQLKVTEYFFGGLSKLIEIFDKERLLEKEIEPVGVQICIKYFNQWLQEVENIY